MSCKLRVRKKIYVHSTKATWQWDLIKKPLQLANIEIDKKTVRHKRRSSVSWNNQMFIWGKRSVAEKCEIRRHKTELSGSKWASKFGGRPINHLLHINGMLTIMRPLLMIIPMFTDDV